MENVVGFWQSLNDKPELQAKMKPTRSLPTEDQAAAEVVNDAADAGFVFSANAFKRITRAYAGAFCLRLDMQRFLIAGMNSLMVAMLVGWCLAPSGAAQTTSDFFNDSELHEIRIDI